MAIVAHEATGTEAVAQAIQSAARMVAGWQLQLHKLVIPADRRKRMATTLLGRLNVETVSDATAHCCGLLQCSSQKRTPPLHLRFA